MQYILINLVFGAMAVAGFSAIWRNWLEDHVSWVRFIERTLGGAHKFLTCGPCFTYWVAFVYTLAIGPLGIWSPFQSDIAWLAVSVNLFLQWMAFSWLSVFLRFAYTALQQCVRKLD